MVGGRHYGSTKTGYNYLSSTETWSPGDSSWTTVSHLPRTVVWPKAVSLSNKIYLIGVYQNNVGDCSAIFVFVGNYADDGATSDANNVYQWSNVTEEWTVHGTILQRRSNVGISLIPRSSDVLNYCT